MHRDQMAEAVWSERSNVRGGEPMKMRRVIPLLACVLSLAMAAGAAAQSGGTGSLRGTVVDEQGAAMPGVTITATSPEAITPGAAVTDEVGNWRIINLPPATYTITAELPGFAVFRREGVILRAGANFQIEDIPMKVGTLEEAITVSGRSPMIEISNPTTTLNMDAEFQRALPLVESRFWTDFLQMTPGVLSRPHNDGSGRQNYFALGVEHREHVTQMEGLMAGNYNDMNINRTGLPTEAIQDTNVKTGGVDAGAPMGYGLVINMIGKSGGNTLSGSTTYALQPFEWNGDNAEAAAGTVGTPSTRKVNQADFSLGGPIQRDKTWFFGAFRLSKNATTPARTPTQVANLQTFFPGQELPYNILETYSPWLKVTTKLTPNHDLVGIYQGDRLKNASSGEQSIIRGGLTDTGGSMYGFNLRSVWSSSITTTFAGNYNNKGGNRRESYDQDLVNAGPSISIHQSAILNAGRLEGSGALASGGGYGQLDIDTATLSMVRGDLTWFKNDLIGSHEFQTGFLLMPRSHYDEATVYTNNGFTDETHKQIDPNDPSAGTVAFHRQFQTGGLDQASAAGRDRDYGVYVQDTWRPNQRLTATYGVRADFLRRFDPMRNLVLQSSTEIGPRAGASFLLTRDARNVLRSSWSRVHRQLMGGRDPVAEFGGSDTESSEDHYDIDGNGTFETVFVNPAIPAGISAERFDPNFRQPYIDEFIVGFQRQFPWDISIDVAVTTKTYHRQYSLVEINGFYPDPDWKANGTSPRFLGFGRINPSAGTIFRVTNNTWADTKYRAMQYSIAKNMSNGFQLMTSFHYQWAHLEPTGDPISPLGWNPTDPARFIEPEKYPNDRNIWRAQGLTDHNGYSSLINNPIWGRFSFRLAGTWQAPYGIVVSSNWTVVAGNYTGPIITQLATSDPQVTQFGPANVVHPVTGFRASNPLATRFRYAFATRAEGQVAQENVHTVGLKLAKNFRLGGARELQTGFNVFNLLNAGNFTEWNRGGANRIFNPDLYLTSENRQPARSFQVDATFRF
jgi:hypothetical protein